MEKPKTDIELTYFFSLNQKEERGGERGENDTNIAIKLEGSSEMLINFRFPKESCLFVWVSVTV